MEWDTPRGRRARLIARLTLAVVGGAVIGTVVAVTLGLSVGILAGWTVFALVNIAWILVTVWPMDADQTRRHARTEAPGRRFARLVSLAGSLASLGAVTIVLLEAGNRSTGIAFLYGGIALLSVAASWALIQVDYMLRLTALYYSDPVGGISFNQKEDPMYTDFIYVAVGLGMTYQIADTSVTSNAVRRMVIAQTLLSYLFGVVILATLVNLVSAL